MKKYDDAEPLFREAIDMWTALGVSESSELANLNSNLGATLCGINRTTEGVEFARKGAEMHQKLSGAEHWTVGDARGIVGNCLSKSGDVTGAETEIQEAYRLIAAGLGSDHAKTKQVAAALIDLFNQSGQPGKAEQFRATLANGRQPTP